MGMALKLLIPLELRRSENAFGNLELLGARTRKDASKDVLAERALASLEASGLDAGGLVSGDREALEGRDVSESGLGSVDVRGLDDVDGVVGRDAGCGHVAHARDSAVGAGASGELLLHVGLGFGLGLLGSGQLGFRSVTSVASGVHVVAGGVAGLDVGLGVVLYAGCEGSSVGGFGGLEAVRNDRQAGGAGCDTALTGREDGLAVADVGDGGHGSVVGCDSCGRLLGLTKDTVKRLPATSCFLCAFSGVVCELLSDAELLSTWQGVPVIMSTSCPPNMSTRDTIGIVRNNAALIQDQIGERARGS